MAGQYFFKVDDKFLPLSGGTVTGSTYVSANFSADTIFSGSTDLGDLINSLDTFVTGSTLSGNTLVLSRNDGVDINTDLSSINPDAKLQNTYFVSSLSGDNSTALVGDINKPFKTITGARDTLLTDALTGQTLIYVYPGTYEEEEIQYENGNMYLSPGVLIKPPRRFHRLDISGVNTGTKTFTVNGNWASYIALGSQFKTAGSTGNDGIYTVSSVSDVLGTTEIITVEPIPDATADGYITSNRYIIPLGIAPTYAPLSSSATTFNLFGEGEIYIDKTIDDDWADGLISANNDSELYCEINKATIVKGNICGLGGDSNVIFKGNVLSVTEDGYAISPRGSSNSVFDFQKIISSGTTWTYRINGFNGTTVLNAGILQNYGGGGPYDAPISISYMSGGRATINCPEIIAGDNAKYGFVTTFNSGGKFEVNGNIIADTGVQGVSISRDTGCETIINGNITTYDSYAYINDNILGGSSSNSKTYINGDIVVTNGTANAIRHNSQTLRLNGEILNVDPSGTGTTYNGINIANSGNLIIDNLKIKSDNESITASAPRTVNIENALYIDKPLHSNITTTGLYNYTGTTNVGDLVIYNTPANDDTLTQILGRNSTTGAIEYVDVSSIAPEAKLQNTYFVSSLSGDNSTALVGDVNKPFKTITGARNQVVSDGFSNSLIYVHAGDYVDYEVQYENGNFYFEPNANVTLSGSTSIFRLGTNLNIADSIYTGNTCNVFGYGNFIVPPSVPGGGVNTMGLNSGLNPQSYFECNSIEIDNGVGIFVANDSKITFKCDLIKRNVGPGTTGCIRISDDSEGYIDVKKIEGGTGSPVVECRWTFGSTFNGKALINIDEIETSPGCLPIFFQRVSAGADITINSNKFTHTSSGISSNYLVHNEHQFGGDITINSNLIGENSGILYYGHGSDNGTFTFNGDIKTKYTAINHVSTAVNTNLDIKYNGDIVVDGDATSAIVMNGSTLYLNGSLKDLSSTGTTNGVTIDGTTDLKIVNFDIDVNTESIVSSAPNEVEIIHSLNINKPLDSNITTTGLYNYTGTTNVGDLVIYNTPINDDGLTQILSRDSSDGVVKYRSVSSIIGAASADTYVTAFTYDNANKFTINDNSGSTFSAIINTVTGLTSTGSIDVLGNVIVTGGTGNVMAKQYYVEGNLGLDWDFGNNAVTLGNSGDGTIINGSSLTINSDVQFNSGVTVDGNALIKGNVTILGSATTIDSETVLVKDNIITLNSSATGTTAPFPIDSGIEVLRNSATTASLVWEETNEYWSAGLTGSTARIILEGDGLNLLNSGHTHPISEVVNLQTELDKKFDITGGTINGDLNVTGDTTLQALSATSLTVDGDGGDVAILRNSSGDRVSRFKENQEANISGWKIGSDYIFPINLSTEANSANTHDLGNSTVYLREIFSYKFEAKNSRGIDEGYHWATNTGSLTNGGGTGGGFAFETSSGVRMKISNQIPDNDNAEGTLIGSGIASPTVEADSSAALEVRGIFGGFLPPKLTTTERDNIASGATTPGPATGLIIFNTSDNEGQINYGTKAVPNWKTISPTVGFTGNTSATCISDLYVSNLYGCSPITVGTEAIFNQDVSGNTSYWFGQNNAGGGSKSSLTPMMTLFDNPSSGNYAGPTLEFSDNGNKGQIFYRRSIGGNAQSNAFNFMSDGGFNFEGQGDFGIGAGFFRVVKGQSSFIIDDNGSAPRTDVKIHNGNGGTAYSRLNLGAQDDYWYFEADDINTPMHIGWDDGVTEKNVFTFNSSAGTIDSLITITSGFTVNQETSLQTLSATTIYSGSTDLYDIFLTNEDNSFSTGGTVTQQATSASTEVVVQINGNDGFSSYNITGLTDTFVSGFTYSANTLTIIQNDGSTIDAELETTDLSSILSAVTFDIGTTGSISATTFYSGSTDLSDIFLTTADGNDITRVQPGTNISTGGTVNNPIVSLDDDISLNSVSATTLSGGTLYSGSTDLSDIFLTTADGNDITRVQSGTNTFTGGTGNNPTINVTGLTIDNISVSGTSDFQSISATTIYSGSTDLYDIFLTTADGNDITRVQPGTNINTGGTANNPIVNLDDDISLNSISANTLSGGTIYSGSTDLSDIFLTTAENTFITGFTYNDANTLTISDNAGSAYTASINSMTGLTINGETTGTALTVNGQSVFSGSNADVVQIYGSGTTSPIFRIQGSSGELFSVNDSLVGELFAVNDISGIPILQVYSDNRIILGDNLAPSLYATAKVIATSGSLTPVYSVPVSAYTGAWFEYTAKDTTSLRAGNIASIFSGTSVSHNETTTTDIGDTSDLLLDVIISGTNATLTASATTSNWEIKTIIRSI